MDSRDVKEHTRRPGPHPPPPLPDAGEGEPPLYLSLTRERGGADDAPPVSPSSCEVRGPGMPVVAGTVNV